MLARVFTGLDVGVEENASDARVLAWPVPAHGELHVQAPHDVERCELLDASGRLMRAFPGGRAQHTLQLDLTGIAPGMYTLVLAGNEGTATARVLELEQP